MVNRSQLICLNLLNVRSEIWRQSQSTLNSYTDKAVVSWKLGHCSIRAMLKSDQKLCINTNYFPKKENPHLLSELFLKIIRKTIAASHIQTTM